VLLSIVCFLLSIKLLNIVSLVPFKCISLAVLLVVVLLMVLVVVVLLVLMRLSTVLLVLLGLSVLLRLLRLGLLLRGGPGVGALLRGLGNALGGGVLLQELLKADLSFLIRVVFIGVVVGKDIINVVLVVVVFLIILIRFRLCGLLSSDCRGRGSSLLLLRSGSLGLSRGGDFLLGLLSGGSLDWLGGDSGLRCSRLLGWDGFFRGFLFFILELLIVLIVVVLVVFILVFIVGRSGVLERVGLGLLEALVELL
jgi:hypothetical protein